jgi:hypothetical protein
MSCQQQPPQVAHRLGRVLILAALACAGGCVVPVAPQWDDAEINYPPYLFDSAPGEGDIFTPGTSAEGREITATLSDQNINDHLFIRWLVEYPSSDMSAAHLIREVELPASGTPIRPVVRIQPDCGFIALRTGRYRWVMSVSDRKFLDALSGDDVDPAAPLDSVPIGANRIRLLWLLECP